MGPNHKDGCNGNTWNYSGSGYNRVKVCQCGAEDHDPEAFPIGTMGALTRAYETAVVVAANSGGHEVSTFADALKVIDRRVFEEIRESFKAQVEELNNE